MKPHTSDCWIINKPTHLNVCSGSAIKKSSSTTETDSWKRKNMNLASILTTTPYHLLLCICAGFHLVSGGKATYLFLVTHPFLSWHWMSYRQHLLLQDHVTTFAVKYHWFVNELVYIHFFILFSFHIRPINHTVAIYKCNTISSVNTRKVCTTTLYLVYWTAWTRWVQVGMLMKRYDEICYFWS